jgi:CMP-N-acetylneuraminic acid synthetase
MSYRILSTICGRAGSKGFKNKNLKTFLDFPLVYYTLSAYDLFKEKVSDIAQTDICLNTDSEELAEIVNSRYPEVYFIKREEGLGGDGVPKPAVWKNCVDIMQEKNGAYDYMIDLDITSPLRQEDDIYNAFHLKLKRPDADMAESVCHARRNPFFNMMKEEGEYVNTVIDSPFVARQQAPNVYDENASIYVLRADYFKENGYNMSSAKTVPYIMRDTAVLDIDSEEDFVMMEVIGKYLYENEPSYRRIRDNIRR